VEYRKLFIDNPDEQTEIRYVIMAYWAGKSLCYQLPAVGQRRTAIVIHLDRLMKNQVDSQLNALGINAHS